MENNVYQKVKNIFSERSIAVWNLLKKSIETTITLNEESITDITLIELKDKFNHLKSTNFPFEIEIEKFNKKDESKNGADWEIEFLEKGLFINIEIDLKIKLRVQAKRIYDNKYTALEIKKRGCQINKLIKRAKEENSIPIYAFYNYFGNYEGIIDNLEWKCSCEDKNLQKMGIALVHARKVQVIKQKKNRNELQNPLTYKNDMMPLHCLLCSNINYTKKSKENIIKKIINQSNKQFYDYEGKYYLIFNVCTILEKILKIKSISNKVQVGEEKSINFLEKEIERINDDLAGRITITFTHNDIFQLILKAFKNKS
ncbi:MAG: hypothetical protein MUC49_10085 [Raineya sp.]|jgi:hypothetical protein|nr:hypothetical protein [Raineya sp.]